MEVIGLIEPIGPIELIELIEPIELIPPPPFHLPSTTYPSPPQAENLEQWFEAIDTDRSGVVEFCEFARLMRALRRAIEAGGKTSLGALTARPR